MNAGRTNDMTAEEFRRQAAILQAETRMFIDGALVDAASARQLDRINPANDAILARVPPGTIEDVDRAVAAERRSFKSGVCRGWSRAPAWTCSTGLRR